MSKSKKRKERLRLNAERRIRQQLRQQAPTEEKSPLPHAPVSPALGERGPEVQDPPQQPFTRSQLQDVRSGLHNGAPLEAIARALQFDPNLLETIPNTIGGMVSDEDLPARDRVSAAKTWALFIAQRMEQEKRDQQIPDRVHHTGGFSLEIVETLVTTRAEAQAVLEEQHAESNGQAAGRFADLSGPETFPSE